MWVEEGGKEVRRAAFACPVQKTRVGRLSKGSLMKERLLCFAVALHRSDRARCSRCPLAETWPGPGTGA